MPRLRQLCALCFFFFFNDTATTEIYTLSLHDALPISEWVRIFDRIGLGQWFRYFTGALQVTGALLVLIPRDRKSTRLNSSHSQISYAVFCLKKKNIVRQRGVLDAQLVLDL